MASDRQPGESISRWLEETAPPRLPDRVLEATFQRTRGSRQHVGWRERVARLRPIPTVPALGAGAVVVVLTVALGLGLVANQPRVGGPATAADPRIPFLDTWLSSDPDGSRLTMTIRASGEEALEIVVTDDLASVCSGASSTMTGTARLEETGELVIPSPAYTCDDGSEPEALSGPPLAQQLRNLTFVLDQQTDALTDNFRTVWVREGAPPARPEPTTLTAVWPQTSLAEVRHAQARADAGDPAFTWQVNPDLSSFFSEPTDDTQIVARFVREVLGWEAFRYAPTGAGYFGRGGFRSAAFIRCAPGRTNALYPNDLRGGGCAPTIDEFRYERVVLDLSQPVRRDKTGIWVVTRWEMIEPLQQVVPPSDAGARALLEAFIRARVAGEGAESYVDVPDDSAPSQDVPLLYATTAGSPFERGESEIVGGPAWPDGWQSYAVRVRLFADGGATVVEQRLWIEQGDEAGRLHLYYQAIDGEAAPTTENGAPVPVQYSFIPDEVTFRAAWPWYRDSGEPQSPRLITLVTHHDLDSLYHARLTVVADPRPIESGCEQSPAPADAATLARAIQADPDLRATAPIAVTIGRRPALQIDVEQAPGGSLCDQWGQVGLVDDSSRMRLYLLDLPGTSVRTLAIALTVSKEDFARAVAGEALLLDSFEFRTE